MTSVLREAVAVLCMCVWGGGGEGEGSRNLSIYEEIIHGQTCLNTCIPLTANIRGLIVPYDTKVI